MTEAQLELDDVVLSRPRLSILAALLANDAADFTFLQKNLGIADGNLAAHLRKLEAEKCIRSKKTMVNGRPKTWFSATPAGTRALEKLLRQLEAMLVPAAGPQRR